MPRFNIQDIKNHTISLSCPKRLLLQVIKIDSKLMITFVLDKTWKTMHETIAEQCKRVSTSLVSGYPFINVITVICVNYIMLSVSNVTKSDKCIVVRILLFSVILIFISYSCSQLRVNNLALENNYISSVMNFLILLFALVVWNSSVQLES